MSTKLTFSGGKKVCSCNTCKHLERFQKNASMATDKSDNDPPAEYIRETWQKANTLLKGRPEQSTVNSPAISKSEVTTESKLALPTALPLQKQQSSNETKMTGNHVEEITIPKISLKSTSVMEALQNYNQQLIYEKKASEAEFNELPKLNAENSSKDIPITSESNVVESIKVLPRARLPEKIHKTIESKEKPETSFPDERPSTVNSPTESRNVKIHKESSDTASANTRPLKKHAKTYELENFEKNLLIIFNQEHIDGYENPRRGTEKDICALKSTFTKFGFEIEIYNDKTVTEVTTVLKSFDYRNFSEYGCVTMVVLTHGRNGGFLYAKDGLYNEHALINALKTYNKPSLVTKPKILIIEACRGRQSVEGVYVGSPSTIEKDECDNKSYTLPGESDIYILHSSYEGKPSHRDIFDGSWLIQTLCKKINELAPIHDLVSIVTEVKQEIAVDLCFEEYNTETLKMETNTQVPVDTSSLLRKFYFRKYGDQPISSITPEIKLEKCSCFMDYFTYIRTCLRSHLKQNADDTIAQYFLEASDTLEKCSETNEKEKIIKAIVKYLSNTSKQNFLYENYKFSN